jgi:hypothetical protein
MAFRLAPVSTTAVSKDKITLLKKAEFVFLFFKRFVYFILSNVHFTKYSKTNQS